MTAKCACQRLILKMEADLILAQGQQAEQVLFLTCIKAARYLVPQSGVLLGVSHEPQVILESQMWDMNWGR